MKSCITVSITTWDWYRWIGFPFMLRIRCCDDPKIRERKLTQIIKTIVVENHLLLLIIRFPKILSTVEVHLHVLNSFFNFWFWYVIIILFVRELKQIINSVITGYSDHGKLCVECGLKLQSAIKYWRSESRYICIFRFYRSKLPWVFLNFLEIWNKVFGRIYFGILIHCNEIIIDTLSLTDYLLHQLTEELESPVRQRSPFLELMTVWEFLKRFSRSFCYLIRSIAVKKY